MEPNQTPRSNFEIIEQGQVTQPLKVQNLRMVNELNRLAEPRIQIVNSIRASNNNEGYVELPPVQYDFYINAMIPTGSNLISTQAYSREIAIGQYFLRFITTPVTKSATIYVEDQAGNLVPLFTTAQVNVVKLSGILVYNQVILGFEVNDIRGGQSPIVIADDSTLFIDQILGYISTNYPEEDNPFSSYSITILNNTKITVVLPDGETTVEEGSAEFFALLANSSEERILRKEYSLLVSPSPEPVS